MNIVRTAEPVMALLGFVWLLLFVVELTRGRQPMLALASEVIWAVFALDFLLEFAVAPNKGLYLRRHWIVLVSLVVPALRVGRVLQLARLARAARSIRSVRLLQTLTSMNRAIASLRVTMRRRGAGYVFAMTVLVTLGGAAGMYAFENTVRDPTGIHDFATALWWTAMIMTTMGSAYWPHTAEGRLLCLALALYSAGVFGYVTAALATFFVNREAAAPDSPVAGERTLQALEQEVAHLRAALADPDRR